VILILLLITNSLTSVVVKVMESIIRDHLVDHMMKNKSFCDAQHGYDPSVQDHKWVGSALS